MPRKENFFHGTSATVPIGGKLLPGKAIGITYNTDAATVGGAKTSQKVFTTQDERTAWQYAQDASLASGDRATVYGANPSPDARPGLFNAEHRKFRGSGREDLQEYASSSATVHTQHNIMPGRQGTLNLNWSQFATKTYGIQNVNHPDWDEVTQGHPGSFFHGGQQGEFVSKMPEKTFTDPRQERLF